MNDELLLSKSRPFFISNSLIGAAKIIDESRVKGIII